MMDILTAWQPSPEYIFNLSMKNAHSNPSRADIISWFNSHIQPVLPPIKKIEELGNGAAYLFLMAALRPGVIRSEKIIKHPSNHHQCFHNLKMLALGFEKLQLNYKIEPDKLALMKYQDNYHLACFLHKTLTAKAEQPSTEAKENSNHSNQSSRVKRYKIIPPEKHIPTQLKKEERPEITKAELEELQSNSGMKLKKIEVAMQESKTNQEKLDKISAILGLHHNKHHQHAATMTVDSSTNNHTLSIEASYKRFLRPSLCQQSSFLNKNRPISFEKEKKVEASPAKVDSVFKREETIVPTNEFDGEMLLSQRKEESQKEEQVASVTTCLLGELASEREKENVAGEQLHP